MCVIKSMRERLIFINKCSERMYILFHISPGLSIQLKIIDVTVIEK